MNNTDDTLNDITSKIDDYITEFMIKSATEDQRKQFLTLMDNQAKTISIMNTYMLQQVETVLDLVEEGKSPFPKYDRYSATIVLDFVDHFNSEVKKIENVITRIKDATT